jgi:pimeloyl-ACP methyl ester carboxylesterase
MDDQAARRRLSAYYGPEQIEEMLGFAARTVRPDAGRRRVLLLHGIMGGQLVDRRGLLDDVIWFDLPQLLYARGIERLRLAPDGRTDAAPGANLEPSRPLRVIYDLLAWHLSAVGGFQVDALAYDWRKPIDASALRLHGQIEALAAGDDDVRFTLVAHSMGGVVATRYASLFPEVAARRLEQAVFLGTPVHGCFEPFQLYAGVHPTAARVEQVASGQGEVVRQVFATFPGLAQLCADPARFDSGGLLDPATWPDLPQLGPWLDRARAWRARATVPPHLLDRLDIVLAGNRPTCAGLRRTAGGVEQVIAPGDGSVTVGGAWCDGARGHFASTAHHPLLALDATVRAGLVELVASRGARAGNLPRLAAPGVPELGLAPALVAELAACGDAADPGACAAGVRARLRNGEVDNRDAMWFLGDPRAPAPETSPPETSAPPRATPPGPADPVLPSRPTRRRERPL